MVEPERLGPLSRADSISLDPHKWLYQPVDCGCLLFKDPAAACRAFSHTGDYTRSFTDDPVEGFAFFDESFELSRRFRALRLWTSMQYHGLGPFAQPCAATWLTLAPSRHASRASRRWNCWHAAS